MSDLQVNNSSSPDHLPKAFQHQVEEEYVRQLWEKEQIGQARFDHPANTDKKKAPFSILMPPPNANASLHAGHAMYVVQDILVRFKRMQGHPTVWFPGTDHAGFESQFVYEKHLKSKESPVSNLIERHFIAIYQHLLKKIQVLLLSK